MKVVAINGSPRKNGNTSILINKVLEELQVENIETEFVQLGGNPVRGCTGCRKCAELKNGRCIIEEDMINDCIAKMTEADGIIIGSPVYFANVSTEIKALIDRSGVVSRANEFALKNKVGAAVVALRRGGDTAAYNAINHMFLINEMIVPGSIYWNMGFGKSPGEVNRDSEGLKNMQNLGQKIAWLLKKINT